jgi:hypothetical protein
MQPGWTCADIVTTPAALPARGSFTGRRQFGYIFRVPTRAPRTRPSGAWAISPRDVEGISQTHLGQGFGLMFAIIDTSFVLPHVLLFDLVNSRQ